MAGARVTMTLIAVNVAIFLITIVRPGITNDLEMLGYAAFSSFGPLHGVAAGEWYRLITAAFLAPATGSGGLGILDIAFNMLALFYVGPALEQLLGRWRYLALYLLSALGGNVLYYWVAPQNQPAIGASGAIFGLFGAWFIVSRKLRLDTRGILTLIVLNLVISFTWTAIAWQAHVGGLAVGVLLTLAYAYAPQKNRTLIQALSTAAMLAALVVAVMLRSHELTSQVLSSL